MQSIISRLNRTTTVVVVLGLVVLVLSTLGLLLTSLPRAPLGALTAIAAAGAAAWLLVARRRLASALLQREKDELARAREWEDKAYWYEQLLDLVQMPITVTDMDMNWTFINAAVEKLLGKSRREIFGQQCNHWGAGICKTQNCGIQRLRKGLNQTIFTQWGMDFLVDTNYLKNLDGEKVGHVEIVTDISTKVQVRGQVREAVESIVSSSGQIEKATHSLADGASTQAANFEQIASTMDNINAQTKVNVESATQAREIATSSMRQAEEGNGKMTQVVSAMREINESSEKIQEIVRTIQDIADQTNLLALNAAIEAARAGDAGRGFAVVADEVSHLSGKSLESVKKTTTIVEEIVKSIAAVSRMVDETAHQLGSILSGTKTVSEISSRTADLNQQQAGAIAQVRQSLDHANVITQETAANSEETSATISNLSRQIADLSTVVDRMKLDNNDQQNAKLEALLAEVKRNDAQAAPRAPRLAAAR